MNGNPVSEAGGWPAAVLHMDGDSFFVACEQAIHPELRGKPVITGKERGIVAAASYEAKARGVQRGVRLSDALKICPELICVPSDYEVYSIYSNRMYDILRRFSPVVEEYSIDEAFADLPGGQETADYEKIACSVQETMKRELDISVSVGVSLTKVLAKVASKYRKPKGLTIIPEAEIYSYLAQVPIGKVWGIGRRTTDFLLNKGITTAAQFARADQRFVQKTFAKPFKEIWQELNGQKVLFVDGTPKTTYQSISKIKTFTPPSADAAFVFAQLVKNLENACIKARRYQLAPKRLVVQLRSQDFEDNAVEVKLSRPSVYPAEIAPLLHHAFSTLFRPRCRFRATAIVLADLIAINNIQLNLFEDPLQIGRMARIYNAMDTLSARFGKHTVHLGASLPVKKQLQHEGARGDIPQRRKNLLKHENFRQRLSLPLLDMEV